jgi:glycosyltransferase involved in cell wall biosynthesis
VKICYILPEYDEETDEHFLHTYSFLELLGKEVDIFLVIERCKGKPTFNNIKEIYTQKFCNFIFLRSVEFVLIFILIRLKGFKKFYVHYSFFGGFLGSLLCKLFGGRVYYWHCVTVVYKKKWNLKLGNIMHKFKAEIPLKLTMKVIDYLVTGTETVRLFYHNTFGFPLEKTVVLPNEIDLNRFNPEGFNKNELRREFGVSESDKIVLFVHRIVERKGAHYIPGIARLVIRQVPEAKFIVAGNGPYFGRLKLRITEGGLGDKIVLLGWVPNREIMKLYAISDIFIMPSEEEGFPRVLLESMAMGIPFVATDVGGTIDICGEEHKKYIFPVGDMENFSKGVIEIIESPEVSTLLQQRGWINVKRFSADRVCKLFIDQIWNKESGPQLS